MLVAVPLVMLLLAGCLGLVLHSRAARRGFVEMHPGRRRWLIGLGLTRAEHFFALEALIVSGHPNRNVARLVLGAGGQQATVYLKRESRVRFGARFLNFLAGFGWVSGPVREARLLARLEREGLPAPRWIATGEDGTGAAFLLVGEWPGTVPLLDALQARPGSHERQALAERLGKTLAAVHEAGFFHRDLYGKHVLVGKSDESMCLLDWQRGRRGAWLDAATLRDLACLHATLPDDLAGPRQRLACLRAYLDARGKRSEWRRWLRAVESRTEQLRRRRHIREKRQLPTAEKQEWIRLDGQALCVTPALLEMTAGQPLDWLHLDRLTLPAGATFDFCCVTLPGGRANLIRHRYRIGLGRYWLGKLTRRTIASPVQRQVTMLWRLQRHGVAVGRVLAIGERRYGRTVDSFLLYQPLEPVYRWADQVKEKARPLAGQWLFQAGLLLARMHEACCYLERLDALVVRLDPHTRQAVEMGLAPALDDVVLMRSPCPARARRDLETLREHGAAALGERETAWRQIERGYESLRREGRLRGGA
jgi:tRNA A-37 threonylcarbamoyl transferase component Bud32